MKLHSIIRRGAAMLRHLISAIVSIFSHRPVEKQSSPGPMAYGDKPYQSFGLDYRHGTSKMPKSMRDYRRWRKVRMQMQRESRRRNRAA